MLQFCCKQSLMLFQYENSISLIKSIDRLRSFCLLVVKPPPCSSLRGGGVSLQNLSSTSLAFNHPARVFRIEFTYLIQLF